MTEHFEAVMALGKREIANGNVVNTATMDGQYPVDNPASKLSHNGIPGTRSSSKLRDELLATGASLLIVRNPADPSSRHLLTQDGRTLLPNVQRVRATEPPPPAPLPPAVSRTRPLSIEEARERVSITVRALKALQGIRDTLRARAEGLEATAAEFDRATADLDRLTSDLHTRQVEALRSGAPFNAAPGQAELKALAENVEKRRASARLAADARKSLAHDSRETDEQVGGAEKRHSFAKAQLAFAHVPDLEKRVAAFFEGLAPLIAKYLAFQQMAEPHISSSRLREGERLLSVLGSIDSDAPYRPAWLRTIPRREFPGYAEALEAFEREISEVAEDVLG